MIHHTPKTGQPFTQIVNTTLRDKRLSPEARGVLTTMLSYPEHWRVRFACVQKEFPGLSTYKLRRIFRELEAAGYARLDTQYDDKGHVSGREWVLAESPMEDDPDQLPLSSATAWAEGASPFPLEPERPADTPKVSPAREDLQTEEERKKPRVFFFARQDKSPAPPRPVSPPPPLTTATTERDLTDQQWETHVLTLPPEEQHRLNAQAREVLLRNGEKGFALIFPVIQAKILELLGLQGGLTYATP